MSEKFWLIQRGKFRSNLDTATTFLGGSNNHLIDPDYMGAAEFEWGAIPAAYSRIMSQFDKYELFPDVLRTVRNTPVCLFCRRDRREDTVKAITDYIYNQYILKEWSNLPQHFRESSMYERHALKTNFWWCIDHDYSPDGTKIAGDWILFVGAADRQRAFQRVVKSDFDSWWSRMDEEERSKRVKEAWRR